MSQDEDYSDFFTRKIDPNDPPPSYEDFVQGIEAIENDVVREEIVSTLRQVLRIQMQMREKAINRAKRWKTIKRAFRKFFRR